MNELIAQLQSLSDGQLVTTTQQLEAFNAAAEQAVQTLRRLTLAANAAAASLNEVIELEKQIQG